MKTEMQASVMLITGTSRGIGRALAAYYCDKGYSVIGCSRGKSNLKQENYKHVIADISVEKDILDIFKMIRSEFGQLHILINNAAVNPAIINAALVPLSSIKKTFETNVFAPMIFCREAVKMMSRKKSGKIINLSSMAAKLEVPGESIYTSTKAAITSYSRVLAKEVYNSGITVNVIAPSVIVSDLSAKINPLKLKEVLDRNAINHWGKMDDVFNAMDFLIHTNSDAITGQVIYLGGV